MSGPFLVRKRPRITEALLYDGTNGPKIVEWANGAAEIDVLGLVVHTDRGDTIADIGDTIVRGLVGEYYPVTLAAFAAGWEVVRT